LYAISETETHWVLLMEYAEQHSVRSKEHSTLTKLKIIIEVANALDHLHSRSPPILHRGTHAPELSFIYPFIY
jgi:serine/threonine protein kinase